MKQFKLVALGGTFDHFHIGHQSLFRKAFSISEKVIIGITSDQFVSTKEYSSQIQSFFQREKKVVDYLKYKYPGKEYSIIELKNTYGPTISNLKIQALIVGPKTISGAYQVNQKRRQLKLPILPIIKANYQKSCDGQYISSTRIRAGEINRQGVIYKKLLKKTVTINAKFRQYLRQKHGKIVIDAKSLQREFQKLKPEKIVWVGDRVGKFFLDNKISFDLGVFDLKIERKNAEFLRSFLTQKETVKIRNTSGIIKASLLSKLSQILQQHKGMLYVQGEEDLTSVSLILLLPFGSCLFYGLKGKGMVMLKVTEEKKEEISSYLSKLTS